MGIIAGFFHVLKSKQIKKKIMHIEQELSRLKRLLEAISIEQEELVDLELEVKQKFNIVKKRTLILHMMLRQATTILDFFDRLKEIETELSALFKEELSQNAKYRSLYIELAQKNIELLFKNLKRFHEIFRTEKDFLEESLRVEQSSKGQPIKVGLVMLGGENKFKEVSNRMHELFVLMYHEILYLEKLETKHAELMGWWKPVRDKFAEIKISKTIESEFKRHIIKKSEIDHFMRLLVRIAFRNDSAPVRQMMIIPAAKEYPKLIFFIENNELNICDFIGDRLGDWTQYNLVEVSEKQHSRRSYGDFEPLKLPINWNYTDSLDSNKLDLHV